ncbi:ferrochelatase [Corynebacterium sp. c8Ua_181]|uniref:Coproporphyrin III ferrochelatase n=2 Tax=Corynebacterium TaxID=1716 RepID=A0A9X3M879_9CORY|nr:ferrochelatase [Corynebacterium curieae]MCZ9305970.1 ferrochelatase [Corynebacterium curieae]MDV2423510.1 ferrochelatase [Corynebacterium curieae]
MTDAQQNAQNFDALLVLSFGGPEGNEEVVPFLENVTRGRGIPRERLEVVGEHYYHFGGVSPLNALNREIIDHVSGELEKRGHNLPIYFGNRNWHPFTSETAEQMAKDGVRRVAVFATSAWGGYSACRQYDEDIEKMREHLESQGLPEIEFTKIRQFFDHPKFVGEMATAVNEIWDQVPANKLDTTRLLFTAHSVPVAHDNAGGVNGDKNLYSRQVAEAARLVAEQTGISHYDLVWQSRSGNPRTPWLEPDIVDHTTALNRNEGVDTVVVCPIGFISDHMEVIWDLDSELQKAAEELGVKVLRTRTAGPTPRFAEMVVDLVEELEQGREWETSGNVTVQGCTVNGTPCAAECCDIWSR